MTTERTPRFADWPQRLALYLRARQNTPFAWAENDCCSFAGNAVMVMTGWDAMRPLRGRYASQSGAARLTKQAGGLEPLVCRYLGMPLESPRMASRGDVVLLANPSGSGPALAICIGTEAASAGLDGVMLTPMSEAHAAWRV